MNLPKKIHRDELETLKKEWMLSGCEYADFPGVEETINFYTDESNNWYAPNGEYWELDLIEYLKEGRWVLEWQGSHD